MKKESRFPHFRGDLFGGLTAGIVALPLALGFGVASGLGAETGLYGAIAIGMLAAIFGGTPTQVSGPTGPMTVMAAALISGGDAATFFAIVVLCGVFQILAGIFRMGGLVRYIPHPVVSGFMSGIGVIIIVLQILPMLGKPAAGSVVANLQGASSALASLNWSALLLGLATIAVVYLAPKLAKGVPGALTALLFSTVGALALGLNVPVIGDIPRGLPSLVWPDFNFATIIIPALTLAALASIDSLLTSLVADKITKTRHDSNRELIGQGLGNMLCGFIGGLPGAGATMRTVVNVQAGGRTRLSGVLHSVLLILILVGLGPLAEMIPLAALAGILVTVGIGIIDYRGLKHLARVPRPDAAVLLLTLGLTVFVGLIEAVAVGVVLSALFLAKRLGDAEVAVVSQLSGDETWLETTNLPGDTHPVLVLHLQGPVFFGNANGLADLPMGLAQARALVIDMEKTQLLDQSGAYALEELFETVDTLDVKLYLAAVPEQPRQLLEEVGIIPDSVPRERVFPTTAAAFVQAATEVEAKPLADAVRPTLAAEPVWKRAELLQTV